jgi:hypothetical protein
LAFIKDMAIKCKNNHITYEMMHDKLDRMVVQSNGRHLDIFLLSIYVVGPLGNNQEELEHILDELIGHLHPRYTIVLYTG